MPVDTSKLRDGDIVHVRRRVTKVLADTFLSEPFTPCDSMGVALVDVVHAEPREIKVGDRVHGNHYTGNKWMRVVAIEDGWAWCKNHENDLRGVTVAVSDLQLADPAS